MYTVTVTGSGPAASREFARAYVNRCQTGELDAKKWKLVFGRADIAGNSVKMTYGNEARVVSTLQRTTQDVAMTTTAKLDPGWGYGIWVRANVATSSAKVTGYSVQTTPATPECRPSARRSCCASGATAPSAAPRSQRCPSPPASRRSAPHRFTVVAKGDVLLYVQIDSKKVFEVASLSAAVAASPWKWSPCLPAPTSASAPGTPRPRPTSPGPR